MNRTLKIKALVIIGVILICIYGVIGIPKSKAEVVENWKKNIRLGLDLRGGSQLVMQVQAQDAFKAEADVTVERIKDELRKANVDFNAIDRNDPQSLQDADKIQINIHGVPATKAGDARRVLNDNFGAIWILTPVNSTDYKLTMKQSEALKLRKDTLTQSQSTIEKKINGLGLTESSVQERGNPDQAPAAGANAGRRRSSPHQGNPENGRSAGTVRREGRTVRDA